MTATATLADVCEITMGQAPSGESYNTDGEGLPLIAGAGDFGDLHPAAKKYTTEATKVCERDDIVLGIRASIGEKVIADGRYCLGRGVAGLRPRSGLDGRFLWHWLTRINPVLLSKAKGATFLQVNRSDIGELPISLPPLPEQRRIAAILDKADALRTKRREALAQIDRLAQSIFLEMFGDAVSPARGWERLPLISVSRIQIGPFGSLLHQSDYISDGVALINPMHIVDGEIKPDPSYSVSESKRDALELYLIREGDLVMGRRGEMGRCAVARPEHEGLICGTGSLVIRPNLRLTNADFLAATISSSSMRRKLQELSLGATLPNLNAGIVGSLMINVPPIELQNQFVHRLEDIRALRKPCLESLDYIERLFISIQNRAFRGEL